MTSAMAASHDAQEDATDATLDLIDREFNAFREAASVESAAAAEAVAALESQLTLTARENARLRAQLDRSQKQVAMLSAKLESRSTWDDATGADADVDGMDDGGRRPQQHLSNDRPLPHTKTSAAAIGQLKEEIYQDLTGLVISRVSRTADETELSCIQTGRNGTLHYKLLWPRDREEQIVYTPMLDDASDDVDSGLRHVLPDYLAEQIMFKQDQAALFAYRLWTAIQKKV